MKPIVTEKAVMMIERENTLTFEVDRRMNKDKIKKEFAKLFDVKIDRVRILVRNTKKYARIKLNLAHFFSNTPAYILHL